MPSFDLYQTVLHFGELVSQQVPKATQRQLE
jgi:hypothetical protein